MTIPDVPPDMRRVMVVGSTGSGKSTLAKALTAISGAKHIEFDAHRFLANWQVRTDDEFRARIDAETQADRWVSCGNYSIVRDITWTRADTIIFLDLPLRLVLWRITKRSLARAITRENLWGSDSRENFIQHLQWNDKSLYFWAVKTYQRRRREIPAMLRLPEFSHLRLVHLTSPKMIRAWLENARKADAR